MLRSEEMHDTDGAESELLRHGVCRIISNVLRSERNFSFFLFGGKWCFINGYIPILGDLVNDLWAVELSQTNPAIASIDRWSQVSRNTPGAG